MAVLAAGGRGFWFVSQGLVNARQAGAISGGIVEGGGSVTLFGGPPEFSASWAELGVERSANGEVLLVEATAVALAEAASRIAPAFAGKEGGLLGEELIAAGAGRLAGQRALEILAIDRQYACVPSPKRPPPVKLEHIALHILYSRIAVTFILPWARGQWSN